MVQVGGLRAGGALALCLTLAACGALPGLLSGPKVAANGQAARTAAQTLGTSTQRDQAIRAASAGRDVVQSADANAVRAGQRRARGGAWALCPDGRGNCYR